MAESASTHFPLSSKIIIAGIALLGIVISIGNYQRAVWQDQLNLTREFYRRADIRHNLTREALDHYTEALLIPGTYFAINPQISRNDFRLIAQQIITRNPAIQSLNWIPEVKAQDRASYEQAASAELGRPFIFLDRAPSGQAIPAAQRELYYPTYFIEPMEKNEARLGFDAGQASIQDSLEEARTSGKVSVTNLISHFRYPNPETGILLTYPVFELKKNAATAPRLLGYIRGEFQVNAFFHALRGRSGSALDMVFIDEETKQVMNFSPADGETPSTAQTFDPHYKNKLYSEQILKVGDHTWWVVYLPKPGWAEKQNSQHALPQLLCGFFMTALITGIIYAAVRRRISVEHLVAQRTRELQVSRAELENILVTLPAVMFRYKWDEKLTFVSISESIRELSGYSADDFLTGKISFSDITVGQDLQKSITIRQNAIAARTPYEIEIRIRTREGSERWILSRGRGVYDNEGTPCFVDGLAIDITLRKETEEAHLEIERKLHEGQKLESLGLLASGIAHDFNNLLVGILGNSSLARIALPENSPALPRLQQIEQAASRAAELCRQMLDYTGKNHVDLEPVNVSVLIDDLLPLIRHSIHGNTRLIAEDLKSVPLAKANSPQLRQIIMNLVLNASDAVDPENGRIEVSASLINITRSELKHAVTGSHIVTGRYISIEVADNGCGISPETLAKIFDPFFTTKLSGRGLGLASTLGIIRNHLGALFVETKLGQGTRFKLLIPPADNLS